MIVSSARARRAWSTKAAVTLLAAGFCLASTARAEIVHVDWIVADPAAGLFSPTLFNWGPGFSFVPLPLGPSEIIQPGDTIRVELSFSDDKRLRLNSLPGGALERATGSVYCSTCGDDPLPAGGENDGQIEFLGTAGDYLPDGPIPTPLHTFMNMAPYASLATGEWSGYNLTETTFTFTGVRFDIRIASYTTGLRGPFDLFRAFLSANGVSVVYPTPEAVQNFAVRLETGSLVTLSQTISTPAQPFDLAFDYRFETQAGELYVMLNGTVLGQLSAPASLSGVFAPEQWTITATELLGLVDVELAFTLDGPTGSSVLLDNIVFPGVINGTFQHNDLAGWSVLGLGSAAVADVTALEGIDIEKLTNGEQADGSNDPDVPRIAADSTVTWTYKVTNTGDVGWPDEQIEVMDTESGVAPTLIAESDEGGDLILSPGETWIYLAEAPALDLEVAPSDVTVVAGCGDGRPTYENTGRAEILGTELFDEDLSHYCNPGSVAIDVRKQQEGPDTRTVGSGADVQFEIAVNNTGTEDLGGVIVIDPMVPDCEKDIGVLTAGDSVIYTCTMPGVLDSFTNVVTATGESLGLEVMDEDPSTVLVEMLGNEGCSPGFWKQPQHLDSWEGHAPVDIYADVFGAGFEMTLWQVLGRGGGGVEALGRQSVAALLNAVSPEVNYRFTEEQVIAIVQDALVSGELDAAKDQLELENERGCPID